MSEIIVTIVILVSFVILMSEFRVKGRLISDHLRLKIQKRLSERDTRTPKRSVSAKYSQANKITSIITFSSLVAIVILASFIFGIGVFLNFILAASLFVLLILLSDKRESLADILFPMIIIIQTLLLCYFVMN